LASAFYACWISAWQWNKPPFPLNSQMRRARHFGTGLGYGAGSASEIRSWPKSARGQYIRSYSYSIAESVLVKQQLLILNRSRQRSPNLRASDRLVVGLCALLICPTRLIRSAIVLKPSTLLNLHQAIQKQAVPQYLSSDHDPLFRFHQWQANLRVLEVKEIKTVP
jgi:hypothetical protein